MRILLLLKSLSIVHMNQKTKHWYINLLEFWKGSAKPVTTIILLHTLIAKEKDNTVRSLALATT